MYTAKQSDSTLTLPLQTHIRGILISSLQTHVTTPVRARFPVGVGRNVYRQLTGIAPAEFVTQDPFELIAVHPTDITKSVLESAPRYAQWGRIVDGEWDTETEPFWERPVPNAIVDRFKNGSAWEDTTLYEAFSTQLRRFGNAWGHTSIDDFHVRCATIDRLYEQLDTNGYQTQAALRERGDDPHAVPVLDEINVDIDRNGELLWRGYGQHRLAIAAVLNIEYVPVLVHRRHKQWYTKKDVADATKRREPYVDVFTSRREPYE